MSGLYGINLLGFAKVKKNCICIFVINEDFETAAQLTYFIYQKIDSFNPCQDGPIGALMQNGHTF
jgi:hypothetical protein